MELNTEKMIGEKEGGIGWMTFNNPARRTAMSLDMWEGVDYGDFELWAVCNRNVRLPRKVYV